jgi:hypothetical protein
LFLSEGGDGWCAQRPDQARHPNSRERAIESAGFDQSLLFARKIDLVLEQASNFPKRIGDQMSRKSVTTVPITEIFREAIEIVHVFSEIFGDVRL